MQALDLVPEIAAEFAQSFERPSGGLLRRYRSEDAETVVVALGSVLGTIEDVDELREHGDRVGALHQAAASGLAARRGARASHAKRVIVLERAFAVGLGGIVGQNVRLALSGLAPTVHDVVAGLGGRAITGRAARAHDVERGVLQPDRLTFLDMDWELVERELQRNEAAPPLRPARREHPSRRVVAARPH